MVLSPASDQASPAGPAARLDYPPMHALTGPVLEENASRAAVRGARVPQRESSEDDKEAPTRAPMGRFASQDSGISGRALLREAPPGICPPLRTGFEQRRKFCYTAWRLVQSEAFS